MASLEDENTLTHQAQDGDMAAFVRLRAHLLMPVRRFVARLIGPGETCDDIVQDTFLALYRSLAQLDPTRNLRPYLFRIARNLCTDELRRRARFEHLPDVEGLEQSTHAIPIPFGGTSAEPLPLGSAPDDAMIWLSLYMEVQTEIERLPEQQRQTLILFADEGLLYAEIAEVMGTSIGTVKSRLFYARKLLRTRLRPEVLETLDEVLQPQKENDHD